MKFNADVVLTDEQLRQLTEAASGICPVKSVDADKNAHLRRDNDHVVLLQSVRFDWLVSKTSRRPKDSAQIL